MRQTILDLYSILQDEKVIVADLLELAKEEREIIVAGESTKLEDVIRLQIKQINKLGALEKKRTEINKNIAREIGIPETGITITAILETATQNEKAKLEPMQKLLTVMVEQHATINAENRELIKSHLEYSETMLELMAGAEDPLNNMYGGDGKSTTERRKSTGFIDGHA
ncbi:MAG: flagellar protein FlgN [Oscillospiraceae bacterium]|nr:flagellar protein FlgN [Oscillospiraceae bacterium]MCL2278251.1 flagellar protein FlgN [Oscillospiraceae bacterium]